LPPLDAVALAVQEFPAAGDAPLLRNLKEYRAQLIPASATPIHAKSDFFLAAVRAEFRRSCIKKAMAECSACGDAPDLVPQHPMGLGFRRHEARMTEIRVIPALGKWLRRCAVQTNSWGFVLRLSLSIFAVAILLRHIDLNEVVQRFGNIRAARLPIIVVLAVLQFALWIGRWQYILRCLRAPARPSFAALWRCAGASVFYAQLLPSSIGSDILRAAIIGRSVGLRTATTSVVVDRLFALGVLAAWAAATLPLVAGHLGIPRDSVVLIEGLLAVGGATALAILLLGLRGERVARILPARLRSFWLDAANLLRPGTMVILVLTSAAMHLAMLSQFYAVASALDITLGFMNCLVLLPVAMLLAALPISLSGWGIREGAVVAALSVVNIAPGDAVTASVLFGLIAPALGFATVWFGFLVERLSPHARKRVSHIDRGDPT
jgi:uncharacterized membrane protein YbhN (UPF0104 family)